MTLYLKQCKEASEELEKTRSREKLEEGDEGEEEESGGEEGEGRGEYVETDCFHLGKRDVISITYQQDKRLLSPLSGLQSPLLSSILTRKAEARASDWSPSGSRRLGEEWRRSTRPERRKETWKEVRRRMAEEGRVGALVMRVRTRVGRKSSSLVRDSQGMQEPAQVWYNWGLLLCS